MEIAPESPFHIIFSLVSILTIILVFPFFKRNIYVKLSLILLVILLGFRYFLWRALYTLNLETTASSIISITLYIAELYGYIHLFLFYIQTYKLTDWKTPSECDRFPTVDVFITTINEPLEIIKRTVIACKALDWPPDKLNVCILDDGDRDEVRMLAEKFSCKYITRKDTIGAKAGNINNALKLTSGEFILFFDVDHTPVRSFLKETIPFFNDEKVAYVHTPHYFYNPDIYQRNLRLEREIANDQDLFFKIIQPGRNYLNADFFGGSDVVIRRSVLEEIGGFKTETLTEDIHTSMHIHAKGYRSIFYNRNITCGLTPETYHDYLRQRMRWAKGSVQFFIFDNPLLKKGLTISQRICYFASFYYFLHGFPRFIYLVAPLSYLLAGIPPLRSPVFDLVNFYFSFYFANLLVFSFIAGKYRQPFWSDVYETVMHFHLCIAVLDGIMRPRKSLYRVTPKGLVLREATYDLSNSFFQLFLFIFLSLGIVYGVWKFDIFNETDGGATISLIWAIYNIFILSAAIIAAKEKPQMRQYHRVWRRIPCEIILSESESLITHTRDLSENGMLFTMASYRKLPPMITIRLISEWGELTALDGKIVRNEEGSDGLFYVGVKFLIKDEEQYSSLIRQIFCQPDAWEMEERELKRQKGIFSSLLTLLSTPIRTLRARLALRRSEPRIPVKINCILSFDDLIKEGIILNLSYKGALISLKGDIPANLNYLTLRIPIENRSITIHAVVRWVRRTIFSTLIGVIFLDMNGFSRIYLEKLLSRQ